MIRLLEFVSELIRLYVFIILAGAVLSWLLAFNVINFSNPFVRSLWQGINAVTEPLLKPIRRMLPSFGGLDLSPIVLILVCQFLQSVVIGNLADVLK